MIIIVSICDNNNHLDRIVKQKQRQYRLVIVFSDKVYFTKSLYNGHGNETKNLFKTNKHSCNSDGPITDDSLVDR